MIKFKKTSAGIVAAAMAALALPGAAQAACPTAPVSQPFAQFGDVRNYVETPGGSFEAGTSAWAGGLVALGNEAFLVRAKTDVQALHIAANGVSTSPSFCVDATYPTMRLFAKKLTGTVGELKVDVVYKDAKGYERVAKAGVLTNDGSYSKWRPSGSLSLASALPVTQSGTGDLRVQLRFTAGRDGAWAIDDVYADPYRR